MGEKQLDWNLVGKAEEACYFLVVKPPGPQYLKNSSQKRVHVHSQTLNDEYLSSHKEATFEFECRWPATRRS